MCIRDRNKEEESLAPVLEYDFETVDGTNIEDISGNENTGLLNGNAQLVKDETTGSQVLSLDGSNGTYAAFPEGFFDGRNTFSISMDIKAEKVSGNYFAFAIGQDSTKYYFLKPTADSIKSVITTGSWGSEKGFTEKLSTAIQNQ